jgi:hypothetical protein
MLVRLYAVMWVLLAAATAGFYLGGYLNERLVTVVGFFAATLVLIGMSVVLPIWVSERSAT